MHKIKNFSHFKKKYVDVQNFLCIYTNHNVDVGTLSWPVGRVAHAEDCKSLYIGSIPVPASKSFFTVFRLSSAVEQSAVNRLVACSNQAAGANKKNTRHLVGVFFIDFCRFAENSDCLFVSGLRIKTTPALVVFTAKGVAFFYSFISLKTTPSLLRSLT